MTPSQAGLERARAAYARRDWPRACELFAAARAAGGLAADDLYALSDAAWWTGDNAQLLDAAEAAFRQYLDEGRAPRAAMAALDMAVVHFLRGDESLGSGWLGRAHRLVEHAPDSVEHAYLVYLTEVEGPLGGIAPGEPAVAERMFPGARRV
jgi:hypothetical protein